MDTRNECPHTRWYMKQLEVVHEHGKKLSLDQVAQIALQQQKHQQHAERFLRLEARLDTIEEGRTVDKSSTLGEHRFAAHSCDPAGMLGDEFRNLQQEILGRLLDDHRPSFDSEHDYHKVGVDDCKQTGNAREIFDKLYLDLQRINKKFLLDVEQKIATHFSPPCGSQDGSSTEDLSYRTPRNSCFNNLQCSPMSDYTEGGNVLVERELQFESGRRVEFDEFKEHLSAELEQVKMSQRSLEDKNRHLLSIFSEIAHATTKIETVKTAADAEFICNARPFHNERLS